MGNPAGAVAALIKNDPMIASNFWLEISGTPYSMLTEVSGLDMEVEVVEVKQASEKGQYIAYKAMGQAKPPGEITIKRVAPIDMTADKLWTWFNTIRDKGMGATDRTGQRKDGSIVVFDAANTELARWNFYNAWPSKISSDSFSATSAEASSETITLQIERLEREEVTLQTEYEFVLPRGYVDEHDVVHRRGIMRLATARDELEPLRDPTVNGPDDPRLTILVLARTIETLGTMTLVTPHEIEGLFAADLAYLQDFYGVINFGTDADIAALLEAQRELEAPAPAAAAITAPQPAGDPEVSHEPGSPLAFESATKGRRSAIEEVSAGGR